MDDARELRWPFATLAILYTYQFCPSCGVVTVHSAVLPVRLPGWVRNLIFVGNVRVAV